MAPSLPSLEVQRSTSLRAACDLFLDDLKKWAYACVARYQGRPPTDVHDQLTYTTGWEPYLLSSRDDHLLRFLETAQEETALHFRAKGLWRHGYWAMQEAHHGTEHFGLFLGFMSRASEGNATTRAQLLDAAEHIGNWSTEVTEWFDHSTGLFRSLFFGTGGVRGDDSELNMPDHLRCAGLLLLSYDFSRDPRFLDLAERYAALWANAICSDPARLPVGLDRRGPVYRLPATGDSWYRSFAGMTGRLRDDTDRAENILASGGIQLFLRLWRSSGKPVFLKAVERLLSVLTDSLKDPDAGAAADAIRAYRRISGKRDYDDTALNAMRGLSPYDIHALSVDTSISRNSRPRGIGKRTDMPVWYEDGKPRRQSPVLLSLAAEITDDQYIATSAVNLAHTYFALATRTMPDGREHGCAATTVSAVACGHGRDNHVGMTTGVLQPIMEHFGLVGERR